MCSFDSDVFSNIFFLLYIRSLLSNGFANRDFFKLHQIESANTLNTRHTTALKSQLIIIIIIINNQHRKIYLQTPDTHTHTHLPTQRRWLQRKGRAENKSETDMWSAARADLRSATTIYNIAEITHK